MATGGAAELRWTLLDSSAKSSCEFVPVRSMLTKNPRPDKQIALAVRSILALLRDDQ